MKDGNLREFTADNFEKDVLQSDLPVLVEYMATWCGPSKALAPIVEKLANEFDGQFKIGRLNIDTARSIAEKYRVRSVPTLMVFREGQKIKEHIGLTTRAKLLKMIEYMPVVYLPG
jgi:thioredoxin 1